MMIKNIILLTKISTRNLFEQYEILKKGEKKLNKKSMYFWLVLIVVIAITLVSNEVLNQLQDINQLDIFPSFLIAIMTVIMFMQTIILSINVLYFSKDTESFLSLAIKPEELLLSRVNTILAMLYSTEIIFMFIPMILYGISSNISIGYYINLIFVMILLPIFPAAIITILSLIFMKFMKFIKNKNLFQLIITLLLVILIVIAEVLYIKQVLSGQSDIIINLKNIADNINRSTIIAEPLLSILKQQDVFVNFLKVIGFYVVLFLILIVIGKKVYLKNLLKATSYTKNKVIKKVNFNIQCEPRNVYGAYLKNEFSNLYRNAIFFLQTIFPIFMATLAITVIAIYAKLGIINNISEISDLVNNLNLTIEGCCIILGIIQILNSIVSISITAISRQGENAIFIKYIPVNLYKQFLLKNVPQVVINIIVSVIILLISKMIFPMISILDLILIFMISIIISILNSYLMLIVDIKRPILNWNAEIDVFKQNGNKIFQYVWTIIVVVILMYIKRAFKDLNLYIGIFSTLAIFAILLFVVDTYVRKQIKNNKLFKNII